MLLFALYSLVGALLSHFGVLGLLLGMLLYF